MGFQEVVTKRPFFEQNDRQTDTTENITFPHSVVGGKLGEKLYGIYPAKTLKNRGWE